MMPWKVFICLSSCQKILKGKGIIFGCYIRGCFICLVNVFYLKVFWDKLFATLLRLALRSWELVFLCFSLPCNWYSRCMAHSLSWGLPLKWPTQLLCGHFERIYQYCLSVSVFPTKMNSSRAEVHHRTCHTINPEWMFAELNGIAYLICKEVKTWSSSKALILHSERNGEWMP